MDATRTIRQTAAPGALLGLWLLGAACAPQLPIEGRSCPCVSGYHCCGERCVAEGTACPTDPAAGGSGAAFLERPSGGASAGGAEDGSAGTSGAGGSGEASSVTDTAQGTWTDIEQLYPPLGNGDAGTNAVDLEVSTTGTLYFSPSVVTSESHLRPLVYQYIGIGWQIVGEASTPEPAQRLHRLLVTRELDRDVPHLLLDGRLYSFRDGAWQGVGEPLETVYGYDRLSFEVDDAGRFYTLSQSAEGLSVARFSGDRWELIGPTLPGADAPLSPLVVSGPRVYLTYREGDASVIASFDGSTWQKTLELADRIVYYYAALPDGTLFVATRSAVPTDELVIQRWQAGTWTDITTVFSRPFAMVTSEDGGLFFVHADADNRLLLRHWHDGELRTAAPAPAEVTASLVYDPELRASPEPDTAPIYLTYIGNARLPKIWEFQPDVTW